MCPPFIVFYNQLLNMSLGDPDEGHKLMAAGVILVANERLANTVHITGWEQSVWLRP